MIPWVSLPSRALLAIDGPERMAFLQGLVTQNMDEKEPCFSAILTPQGRFFTDFFVLHTEKTLIIDCAKAHHAALLQLLTPYSLLHDVSLRDCSTHYGVCAALGSSAQTLLEQSPFYENKDLGAIFYADPRHPSMGLRALVPYAIWNELPHLLLEPSPESVYHQHRIALGIPEGAYDLVHQQSIILEYGYQHIHALSWTKGCYMGQELMARTFHRGVLRKHLYRVRLVSGQFPPSGTGLLMAQEALEGATAPLAENTRVGWIGSHQGPSGLAALHQCVYNAERPLEPVAFFPDCDDSASFSVLLNAIYS